jgi:hypothetical protein
VTIDIEGCVTRMIRGEEPTRSSFACPVCGGRAHMSAVPRAASADAPLSVAGWCEDCADGVEMDGVRRWPGWEAATTPVDSPPGRFHA